MTRVIPVLLIKDSGLVKTVKFKNPIYIGDPRNAVKIFNDKEVDELIILDISATRGEKVTKYSVIQEIVSEAFMPVAYGGGIKNIADARKVLSLGVEKIVINSIAVDSPSFVHEACKAFGGQSITVSVDVKKNILGNYHVYSHGGQRATKYEPVKFSQMMEELGAGELIIHSIQKDGTMEGYDIEIIKKISSAVNIPVIACGGAGSIDDFKKAVKYGRASAVAAGSIFVYHGRHRAVLISYPQQQVIREIFS